MLGILSQRRQSTAIFSSIIKIFYVKQREREPYTKEMSLGSLSLSSFSLYTLLSSEWGKRSWG